MLNLTVRAAAFGAVLVTALSACGGAGSQGDRTELHPLEWKTFEPMAGGRELNVRYGTNSTSPLRRVDVREDAETVRIALRKSVVYTKTSDGGYEANGTSDLNILCVRVPLARPLGDRSVLAIVGASSRPASRGDVPGSCKPPPHRSTR